jgi:hypothetical protein
VTAGRNAWLIAGNDRGVTASAELQTGGTWTNWTPPCAGAGYSFSVPVALNDRQLLAQCSIGTYGDTVPKSAPRGAALFSQWLYSSANGGRTFQPVREIRSIKRAPYWNPVEGLPAEPSPGVILTSRPVGAGNAATLIESLDSGRSWRQVYGKSVLNVAFPTARLGLAIAETTYTTSQLIWSHDGGDPRALLVV